MFSINPANLLGDFVDCPLIIAGAGRSGTTALLNALGEHPEVLTMHGERPYVTYVGGVVQDFEDSPNGAWRVGTLNVSNERLYKTYRELCFESAFGKGGWYALKNIARKRVLPSSIKYWSVKAFPTETQYKGFLRLYPSARVVAILRNGIDNVNSRMHHATFRDDPFEHHCTEWVYLVGKYDYLNGDPEHAVFVRQEELRDTPEIVFSKIFDVCGLSQSDKPLQYAQTTVVHPLDKSTRKETDVKAALNQRAPAYESWTDEQRMMFKDICGETMERVGYEIPF